MKRYADIDADYAAQIKGLPKFKQYGVALKAEAIRLPDMNIVGHNGQSEQKSRVFNVQSKGCSCGLQA